MGEARRKALAARKRAEAGASDEAPAQVVDTLGGRVHVRWDEDAAVVVVFRGVSGPHRRV